MSSCAVGECAKPAKNAGMCWGHYNRKRRHGHPTAGGPALGRPVAERFWEKVDKSGECWLWTGSLNWDGYGMFRASSSTSPKLAHRAAYELAVTPVPDGLELDHLCRVRHCVNPAHLEPVTHTENMHRAALARRQ